MALEWVEYLGKALFWSGVIGGGLYVLRVGAVQVEVTLRRKRGRT